MIDKDSLKKKYNRFAIKYCWLMAVIFICVLEATFVRNAIASPLIHRIAGYTQYDTSSDIAKEGWTQSDYAILAFGVNYPDALAAAPLAKKYNAPILLTEAKELTPITKQTLQDLKIKTVFLVGGTAVVSLNVENQVKDLGINVVRLAGYDRYDTAIEIAKQLGDVQEIFVVSGDDYADALSISPIAASKNAAIVLVPKDHLTDSIKSFLSLNKIAQTYLIGTMEQISVSVSNLFPNVERITGSDKYDRNVAVLNRFETNFDLSKIYIATGNGFADALAGSVYAATQNAPIVLVDNRYNHNTGDYLNTNRSIIKQINILGGEVIMPSSLVQRYINPTSQVTPPSLSYTASEIAKKCSPSIVNIEVSDVNGIPFTSGSGYIIDSTGRIATNYHIIKGANSAKVKTNDGKVYDVSKVLAYDSKQDLALLKIDATGLQPVTLGNSDKIGTGDKIYTVGNPTGKADTISDGIISTKFKVVDGASYIQITALISPGTSGGVLVNEQAEIIGTTTVDVTSEQNLYLSTPINLLKPLLTLDINLTLAQLPRESLGGSDQQKMTDQAFAESLNVKYGEMNIANKIIRCSWKVNDYQSGVSEISIHGTLISKIDYENWMEVINANERGTIMLYFAQINNYITENYSGKSFLGNILYQDYYTYIDSKFPYNDVTFAGDGKWLVKHTMVSFYDLDKFDTSGPSVRVSD